MFKIVAVYSPVLLKQGFTFETELFRQKLDAQITLLPHKTTSREILYGHLSDADALLTDYQQVDADLLAHSPSLRCVSLLSTGYNVVDIPAAKKAGVSVCHVREYCTQEVAEHTMALLLALTRNLRTYISDIEKGIWEFDRVTHAPRLQGQTLCLFGLGKISRAVATRAAAFGLHITAVSQHATMKEAQALGIRLVTPEEACETADIISNHMALTPETQQYFNRAFFEKLRRSPIFLNLGRGGSVNETDLAEALDKGWVRAAGLDLLWKENPELDGHPLLGRENVIITPHAGFYSETSLQEMIRIACENIIYCLRGEPEKVDAFVFEPPIINKKEAVL